MKKTMKLLFVATILASFATSSFAKPNGIDRIKRAGTFTVGVKDDVPGFGYINPQTKQYEGLEIDIAKAIAKQILGSEDKVTFIPVNAKNRSAFFNQDRVDAVIATFTVTEERKQNYDLTSTTQIQLDSW